MSLEDHELLLEVEKEFIEDKTNLLILKKSFPSSERYAECMRLLLSNKVP
jgi:Casein kinase II regulatory subunit